LSNKLNKWFILKAGRRRSKIMSKEQIYENFIELFDDDDLVKMKALLYKSKWILNKFYIPYQIMTKGEATSYTDLDCLLNSALPFRFISKDSIKSGKAKESIDLFNKGFMFSRLYTELPTRPDKNTFYVEVDFRKLKKEYYKQLVASFFYCLDLQDDFSPYKSSDIRSTFRQAIIGNENEAVIILPKKKLDHNAFEISGFTKMYIYNDVTEKEEIMLKKIAKALNLQTVQVHV